MYHLLYKYLLQNNEVSLPGIGAFILEKNEAELDPDTKVILAPKYYFKMVADTQGPDHDFHSFIAEEQNITIQAAVGKLENFIRQILQTVNQNKWLELPGIGTLTPGIKEDIKFKSVSISKDYYPDISLEKSVVGLHKDEPAVLVGEAEVVEEINIATESDEIVEKVTKDYWWVYAIILLLIGIAAIVYYYLYGQPLRY